MILYSAAALIFILVVNWLFLARLLRTARDMEAFSHRTAEWSRKVEGRLSGLESKRGGWLKRGETK